MLHSHVEALIIMVVWIPTINLYCFNEATIIQEDNHMHLQSSLYSHILILFYLTICMNDVKKDR